MTNRRRPRLDMLDPGRPAAEPPEEEPEEPEEEEPEEEPRTSLDDLVAEADGEDFDSTFRVTKSDVRAAIGEEFPVPQPWQSIPRVAVTVNLNYVYDREAGEWVRQGPLGTEGLLREVLDSGSSVATAPLKLDFADNLDVSVSGADPAILEVAASGGGGGGGGLEVVKSGQVSISPGATQSIPYPTQDAPVFAAVEALLNRNAEASVTYGSDVRDTTTRSVRIENVGFSSATFRYAILTPGSGGGGGSSSTATAQASPGSLFFASAAGFTQVPLGQSRLADGLTVDTGNDRIEVLEGGTYGIYAQASMVLASGNNSYDIAIRENGTGVLARSTETHDQQGETAAVPSAFTQASFQAGDTINAAVSQNTGGSVAVLGDSDNTFLSVYRLA